MCRQHWVATTGEIGEINFNASLYDTYEQCNRIEIILVFRCLNDVNIMAVTSNEATVDTNGDGQIWVGNEVNAETPDLWGQFNLSIRLVQINHVTLMKEEEYYLLLTVLF